MKKLIFLLLSFLFVFSLNGDSKTVRVVTVKGLVFEGTLIELKAFEYVALEIDGKTTIIPYDTMAYIDEVKTTAPVKNAASVSKPVVVEKKVEKKTEKKAEPQPVLAEVKPEPVKKTEPAPKPVVEEKKAEPKPVVAEVKKAEPAPKPVMAEVKKAEVKPEPVKKVESASKAASAVKKPEVKKAETVAKAATPVVAAPVAAAPVVKKAVVEEKKAEPVKKAEPKPKKAVSKMNGFKGFLLERGNKVYLMSISEPVRDNYEHAALDVLRRQVERDGFWKITDNPDEAHFILAAMLNFEGKSKISLSIASELSKGNEELGDINAPENLDDYRKTVWELYNKTIVTLQEKIDRNKVAKRIAKGFTVE